MTARDGIEKVLYDVSKELGRGAGRRVGHLRRKRLEEPLPSRRRILDVIEHLRADLFPGYFGRDDCPRGAVFHISASLAGAQRILSEQIRRAVCFSCRRHGSCASCGYDSNDIVAAFLKTLPRIQELLELDVQAAYNGDPAATSPAEAIFCYPGIMAIANQRIAHELYNLKVPLIPRMITENSHSATGIDIHPGARIGSRFFIDHGTGVVIGETATIGSKVRIYQGVTLGAKNFPLDKGGNPVKGLKRHPDIEDNVVIYAGAAILGPVRVGRNSIIGGNVCLTKSVPPNSKVVQGSARGGRDLNEISAAVKAKQR